MEYLSIRDGKSDNDYELIHECGNRIPPVVTSSGNIIRIHFHSDHSLNSGGFELQWQVTAKGTEIKHPSCFGTKILRERSGKIESHMAGSTYHSRLNCKWQIIAPEGMYVRLRWLHFLLENVHYSDESGDIECYDWVAVYDGNSTNAYTLQRECGKVIPPAITSSQNIMTIQFITDSFISGEGFLARWDFTYLGGERTCSGAQTIHQSIRSQPEGIIWGSSQGYAPDSKCAFYIHAPVGHIVSLKFLRMNLAHQSRCSDRLLIYDIDQSSKLVWTSADKNPENYFCKGLNAFFTVKKNTWRNIKIVFRSDRFLSASGFKIKWKYIIPPNVTDVATGLKAWNRTDLDHKNYMIRHKNMTIIVMVILIMLISIKCAFMLRCIKMHPERFPKCCRCYGTDDILGPDKGSAKGGDNETNTSSQTSTTEADF